MKYCYHCMTKIEDNNMYCPECGNKSGEYFPQSEELPAGTMLCNNRYLVGVSIGSGGFGISYIGYDLKLQKKVLVKETFYKGMFKRNCYDEEKSNPLYVEYGENFSLEDIMQKTHKECVALSEGEELSSIVKVYDWFSENNTSYIITEFINGVTLYERVFEKGHYRWEELYGKIKPLMFSLATLHEKHLLHRDIKPQNIMIRELKHEGEKFVLIDFGLARSISAQDLASAGVSFSPGYAPYEQRSYMKIDDTYTDVYSLAATIYFALTGEEPNTEFYDSVEGNFPRINELNSKYGVPMSAVNALRWALAPRYDARCQTVTDFISAIESGLEQEISYREPINPVSENPAAEKKSRGAAKIGFICGLAAVLCVIVLIPVLIMHSDKNNEKVKDVSPRGNLVSSCASLINDSVSSEVVELANTDSEIADTNVDLKPSSEESSDSTKSSSDTDKKKSSDTDKSKNKSTSDTDKKSDGNKIGVPLVVGMKLDEAKRSLEEKGLKYKISESYSDNVAKGVIISQKPKENSKVEKGNEIVIEVSKGADKSSDTVIIKVPNVVGKTIDDATKELISSGCSYTTSFDYNSEYPKGYVFSQQPAPGTQSKGEVKVNIIVSDGAAPEQETVVITEEQHNDENPGDNNNNNNNNAAPAEDNSRDKKIVGVWESFYRDSLFVEFTEYRGFTITFKDDGTFEALDKTFFEEGIESEGTYRRFEDSDSGEVFYELEGLPGYDRAYLRDDDTLELGSFDGFITSFERK